MPGSLHLHLSTLLPDDPANVIRRVVELAHRLEAAVEVTVSMVDPIPTVIAAPHAVPFIQDLGAAPVAIADELVEAANTGCAGLRSGHTVSKYAAHERSDPRLVETARTNDFSALGIQAGDQHGRWMLETLVFGSGRPVLVLPWNQAKPLVFRKIYVAWDGSEAASRCLALALPYLKAAEDVEVMTVLTDDSLSREAAGRAADYLKRHGIRATPYVVRPDGRKTGAQIIETAANDGADLLVMGAYSKPRVQGLLFGSVTRTVLEKHRVPLLVAN